MPYIKEEDRDWLKENLPSLPGELNYIFTTLCLEYLAKRGESYQTYNDILGALEGCKLELYRRRVAPYEDEKCRTNGDVEV